MDTIDILVSKPMEARSVPQRGFCLPWSWLSLRTREVCPEKIRPRSLAVVMASARRHYLSRAVVKKWAGGQDVIDALERAALERELTDRTGRPRQLPAPSQAPNMPAQPYFLLVAEVAVLARKTVRQVYHDIEKGAVAGLQLSPGSRILIRIAEAEAYAGRRWPLRR